MKSRLLVFLVLMCLMNAQDLETIGRLKEQIKQQYGESDDKYQNIISKVVQNGVATYFVKYNPQKIYKVIVDGDDVQVQMVVNNSPHMQFYISSQMPLYQDQSADKDHVVKHDQRTKVTMGLGQDDQWAKRKRQYQVQKAKLNQFINAQQNAIYQTDSNSNPTKTKTNPGPDQYWENRRREYQTQTARLNSLISQQQDNDNDDYQRNEYQNDVYQRYSNSNPPKTTPGPDEYWQKRRKEYDTQRTKLNQNINQIQDYAQQSQEHDQLMDKFNKGNTVKLDLNKFMNQRIKDLTAAKERRIKMQVAQVDYTRTLVYNNENMAVVLKDKSEDQKDPKVGEQEMISFINEENQDYYRKNPGELLEQITESDRDEQNDVIVMTFDPSSNTMNSQWTDSKFEYVILRKIDGQYKCIDNNRNKESVDGVSNQIKQELQESDIVIVSQVKVLSRVGESEMEKFVNSKFEYNPNMKVEELANYLRQQIWVNFLHASYLNDDLSVVALIVS